MTRPFVDEVQVMEVLVFFGLLCLSVKISGHQTPQINNVSRNQTWHHASNDSSCSMIGLNLTGEIEENIDKITSSIAWDAHQIAWIGAYAKRVWINFDGCFFGRYKSNDSWLTITSPGNPAKTCLKHCDYKRFVLTEGKCVCYNDVMEFTKTGCIARECSDTKYTYCGKGNAPNSKNITFHCMCRFSIENKPSSISDEGDCLAVTYKPEQQFIARNCSYKYRPICYNPDTKEVVLTENSNNWLQSLSECYDNNKQFAGRTTNMTGPYNGTYWVGTFAVTYTLWGCPSSENDSCVAVSIDGPNNHLTTFVLPCDTFLPVLCSKISLSTPITTGTTSAPITTGTTSALITTGTTILSTNLAVTTDKVAFTVLLSTNTRLDTTSISVLETTSNEHPSTSHNSQSTVKYHLPSSSPTDSARETPGNINTHPHISAIVGSVVGTLVILIIIVLILLWRRGAFRKTQRARSNKSSDELKMRNPSREDNTGTDDSIPNDVYDHLGEIKTKQNVSGDDLYDHTGAEGETYEHLNSERYDEDSEYDHTFNHTASDTYGHLNTSYLHGEDNEYDHTCTITPEESYGRLNRNSHQSDNDNNYDHTGDMYGRLHADKNRDVGDDVYDHTGGSGNMYGHINISQPEGNSEYGHIWT